IFRAVLVCTPNTHSREADAMRKLTFGMNLSLDGYIAASGDDLGWSVPSDELFQWWSDRGGGRRWGEGRPPARPPPPPPPAPAGALLASPRRWRDMPKVVFSSMTSA